MRCRGEMRYAEPNENQCVFVLETSIMEPVCLHVSLMLKRWWQTGQDPTHVTLRRSLGTFSSLSGGIHFRKLESAPEPAAKSTSSSSSSSSSSSIIQPRAYISPQHHCLCSSSTSLLTSYTDQTTDLQTESASQETPPARCPPSRLKHSELSKSWLWCSHISIHSARDEPEPTSAVTGCHAVP